MYKRLCRRLSIYLSIYLSMLLPICLSIYLSIYYLSVNLSIYLSVCRFPNFLSILTSFDRSIYLCNHLCIHVVIVLSFSTCIYLFVYLPVYLFCPSIRLSICRSTYLYVCPYLPRVEASSARDCASRRRWHRANSSATRGTAQDPARGHLCRVWSRFHGFLRVVFRFYKGSTRVCDLAVSRV